MIRGAALSVGLLLFACSARAAEITGTVKDVNGSVAAVQTSGGTPAVGDTAEFFFKLAGADEEISVATGTVIGQDGGAVKVKIENATGDVAKDQLVRFISGKGAPPAATLSSAAQLPALATPETTAESSPVGTLPPSVPFPSAPASGSTKAAPPNEKSDENIGAPYVNKGIAQYSAGNIDGAIASYTAGIRAAPSVAVLYLNRANAYLYKPNFNAAIADANKALELKVTKTDDAYTIRGTAKAGLGDYDSALADCNRAIKINPSSWLAYNNRANNRIRKRDYKGALGDCNKSISLDSSSALPFYNRGFVYYNLGNASGALSDWKKAVAKQASFGAELNPKIAQLEAQGVQSKQSAPPKPLPSSGPGPGEWTDLTNAAQKMVGTWRIGPHRTRFSSNGTFVADAHLSPDPPRGQWQVQGDRLVQYFPQSNQTLTNQILSISSKTLVIRSADGQTYSLTKQK